MIHDLHYEGIKFLFQKRIVEEWKEKTIYALMYSVMKIL